MWQKLRKSYPPQLELIALLVLVFTVYWVIANYDFLSETIPTHFNFHGIPDKWGSKNEILVFPIMGAFLYIVLTTLNIILAVAKDLRKYINLPPKRKAVLSDAKVEELRIFLNRSLFTLKVVTQGLVAYLLFMSIEVAQGKASDLGQWWLMFLLAILMIIGYLLWKSYRLTAGPG
ncbi:MAG: DUF1648 domain-containing protein [Dehalococcoidales bacterium]|jgi:uncharacterized membrane protein|nr:DUF1648 domain-containing protein [Dehalococcoidales bacterium]